MKRIKIGLLSLAMIFTSGCAVGPLGPQEGVTFALTDFEDWSATEKTVPWGPSRAIITEMTPPGETLQNWQHMVTFITVDMRRYDKHPTGLSVAATMQGGYNEACGKTSFGEPVSSVEDGYPTTLFYVACDRATEGPTVGSGDYTFVKVIEAAINLFIVQRAWRGELPDPTVRPISDAEYEEWMKFFDSVRVMRF